MLTTSSSQTIGILAPWMAGEYLGNILIAIQHVAQRHELRAMMICTAIQTTIQRNLSFDDLIPSPPGSAHVCGWITIGNALHPEALERLAQSGTPIVTVSSTLAAGRYPLVVGNNRDGMADAVRHLLDHGHTQLAFVGTLVMSDMQERYEGYKLALAERGIEPNPAFLYDVAKAWPEYGEQVVQDLVAKGLPCTALVCANDDLAYGALRAMRALGRHVPDDLAVIGFDDHEQAQYQDPPLTTVSQKSYALGEHAAELLVKLLSGEEIGPGPHRVETALVKRRSCGCDIQGVSLGAGTLLNQSRPWQALLAERMLTLALYPLRPSQELPLGQQWPGIEKLIQTIDAAVHDQPLPESEEIATAWNHALELTSNLKILHALIGLLEQAGNELLQQAQDQAAAKNRLVLVIERLRYDLSQTLLHVEATKSQLFMTELRKTDRVTEALLHSGWFRNNDVSWLKETSLRRGCLGIWEAASVQAAPDLQIIGVYGDASDHLPPIGSTLSWERFLPTLVNDGQPAERVAEMTLMVPFETTLTVGGILSLVDVIDSMFLQRYEAIYHWVYTMTVAIEREVLVTQLTQHQQILYAKNRELERAKEAAEQANRLKTQFVANMSHELRTPLNAILNFTQFMGDADISGVVLNERQNDFQQRVISNGEHLLGLINDILDLAKIEAGKMEIHPAESELKPLLQGVMSTAIGLTADKGLALVLDLPTELPPVWIDKTRVRQVLLNLLSNAAKFTEVGRITIGAGRPEAGFVTIRVQDTGIGIPLDKQELVFEEFQQIDSELNRQYVGTGLGMPISKRFIELHGGRMWMESTPGHGTTFFFTIPVAPGSQEASPVAADQAAGSVS